MALKPHELLLRLWGKMFDLEIKPREAYEKSEAERPYSYRVTHGDSRELVLAQLGDISRVNPEERPPLKFYYESVRDPDRGGPIYVWLLGAVSIPRPQDFWWAKEAAAQGIWREGDLWFICGYSNGWDSFSGSRMILGVYDARRREGYLTYANDPDYSEFKGFLQHQRWMELKIRLPE